MHRLLPHSLLMSRFAALTFLLTSAANIQQAAGQSPAPDFAIFDDNSTSATYQTIVSPREYLGKVSGWYFGHGT